MSNSDRTDRTLANVLRLMRADDVMPKSAKDMLLASCGEIRLSDLTAHDGGSLAEMLVAANASLVDECDILMVSERILAAIGRMGYTIEGAKAAPAEAPVSPAPAGPISVTLNQPTRREDMNLSQLLEELVAHPDDAEEILDLIRQNRTVRYAVQKLNGGQLWAIANDGGGLNVPETIRHLRHLADPHTAEQPKWRGTDGTEYWPTTIELAIGRERQVMLYPFPTSGDLSAALLVGPDRFGRDWSKLDETRHEAILWAVMTMHRNLVGNTNFRQITDDLFATTLPAYLSEIVEEYRRAKRTPSATHHREAKAMSRFADDDTLRAAGRADLTSGSRGTGSRLPFGGSPVRDESWYREQLESEALSRISESQASVRRSRVILMSVTAHQGSIFLTDCIVLGRVFAAQGSISGKFWLPKGQMAQAAQGSVNAEVRNWTYEQLYNKAVELGIITPR